MFFSWVDTLFVADRNDVHVARCACLPGWLKLRMRVSAKVMLCSLVGFWVGAGLLREKNTVDWLNKPG